MSHDPPPVAVQLHPLVVVTLTVPVPPVAVSDRLAGEIVYAHAPACVTVNVLPATVSVPVREAVAVLAATLNLAVPFPDPDAPAVTVIHELLLTAVHAQVEPVVMAVVPVPPAAVTDWLLGDIDGVQEAVNENVLDRAVRLLPPGPMASMRVS